MDREFESRKINLAADVFASNLETLDSAQKHDEHRDLLAVAIKYLYPTLRGCSPHLHQMLGGDDFESALSQYAKGDPWALSHYLRNQRRDAKKEADRLGPASLEALMSGNVASHVAFESMRAALDALASEQLHHRRAKLKEAFHLAANAVRL